MKNGYYWINYRLPKETFERKGLFLVEWDFNSLGDIQLKSVDDFDKIISKDWILETVEIKNPFSERDIAQLVEQRVDNP